MDKFSFNKKPKDLIIVIICFLTFMIIIVPYFVYNDFEKAISVSGSLLQVLFSLGTLILAVWIYDKYDSNKKITQERIDLLVRLIVELKLQRFFCSYKLKGGGGGGLNFFPGDNMLKYIENEDDLLTCKVCFGTSYGTTFREVYTIKNHPLLPSKIVKRMEFLEMSGGKGIDNKSSFAKILYNTKDINDKLNDEHWFFSNNNDCTVKQYIIKYHLLFNEIDKWFKENSNLPEKFNMNSNR